MTSFSFKFKLHSSVRFRNVVGREDYQDFDDHPARVCGPPPSPINGMTYKINLMSEDGKNVLTSLTEVPEACLLFTCCKCFKLISTSQLCGKCRIANYCGRDCQLADWPDHKGKCNLYSQAYSASKSPLYIPAMDGDLNEIRQLVESGADVNKTDSISGESALMMASGYGNLKVVKYLIEHGADIAHFNNEGVTALDYACLKSHTDVVNYLLRQGAEIETTRNDGTTHFMAACKNGRLAVVKLLIEHSVDVNRCGPHGLAPIMIASIEGKTDIVRCLVDAGADLEKKDEFGYTALLYATIKGRVEIVTILLDHGVSMERVDMKGDTPLIVAAAKSCTDVVRVLVHKGANKDFLGPNGTALFVAVKNGNLSIVQFLTQKGADVNIRTSNNNISPLVISIMSPSSDQIAIVKCLLDHGAVTAMISALVISPLACAIKLGKLNLVQILVRHGAGIGYVSLGITALDMARTFGHEDIATFLLEQGAV